MGMRVTPSAQLSLSRLKRHVDFAAAGTGIADHADLRPELRLPDGEIVHVTEQTSDRRTQTMKDAEVGAHETRDVGSGRGSL